MGQLLDGTAGNGSNGSLSQGYLASTIQYTRYTTVCYQMTLLYVAKMRYATR